MIKNLLICVDGSRYSDAAVQASVWLGKKLNAKLRALSVVDLRLLEGPWISDLSGMAGVQPFQALAPQIREFHERKAGVAIAKAAKAAEASGISLKEDVQTGFLVETVFKAEKDADLVVLGQKGEGHESTGEWLGSHTDRIVRKSIKPCLVVPSQFQPIRSILVAFDGSEHARHALEIALELAKTLGAGVTLLTVENAHGSDEEKKSWALKEAEDVASRQGVAVKPFALHGVPEEKILSLAAEQGCELIVMGAYGHTRLRELILGSVTHYVIRKSPVPVLLCR